MTALEIRISGLFDELVPMKGKADTVAGEIARAINRIVYRNWNDGDHLGVGYGRETCNPAGRYLAAKCGPEVEKAVSALWGVELDETYDKELDALMQAVLDYLDGHPELRTTKNTEDMWDYRDRHEDVDSDDDEEEDW